MDTLGHCYVAEMSGEFAPADIYTRQFFTMLIPNIFHCHDWAYRHILRPEYQLSKAVGNRQPHREIKAHLIADWIIHYGSDWSGLEKRKCGWAYRKMGLSASRCRDFYSDLNASELLLDYAMMPENWNKKKRLDFHHSAVEYALDIIIADRFSSVSHFITLQEFFSAIKQPESEEQFRVLLATLTDMNFDSDRDIGICRSSFQDTLDSVRLAQRAADIPIYGFAKKYGLKMNSHALAQASGFLYSIVDEIAPEDAFELCCSISRSISRNL